MFIDRVKVRVRAGNGGRGCVSFHREKFVPMGGPDGGNGGRGGDIIFYVDPSENTLTRLHSRTWYAAGDGGNGEPNNRTGANGATIRLAVAPGTVVQDAGTGEVLADLVDDDQEAVIAAGGMGGKGNTTFATATHQTPRYAQPGQPGEERILLVELKVVADIGLVGFPNAGKSTLLNHLTSARAKVGDYPFTTLNPVLGAIPLDPGDEAELGRRSFESGKGSRRVRPRIVIADIPGILKGAHEGVGLGLEFLRHIERTQVLLFLVDVSVRREHEPEEAYLALRQELLSYKPSLLYLPRLVALTKIDEPLDPEEVLQIKNRLESIMASETPAPEPGTLHPVSALSGEGLEELRQDLVRTIIRGVGEGH
jgi:GTP-binding protein